MNMKKVIRNARAKHLRKLMRLATHPVATKRYICSVCGRTYRKPKMDLKFHDPKHRQLGNPPFEMICGIYVNGIPVQNFDPTEIVRFKKMGILK